MNHLLSATALAAALSFTPALASANNYGDSHERCKRDEDNRQILGGFAGAVLGGVIGSQVAGSGARTEGSVIAGTIGALAGAGIADKTIDCDPVYPEQRSYSSGSTYSSAPVYSSGTTYGGTTSHQTTSYPSTASNGGSQTYQDRVTVSNHPVYSDPTYGADTASYSSGYTSGTTSYAAPSTSYSLPATTTYASAPITTYASQTTYAAQPTYASQPRTVYVSQPTTTHYAPSYSRSTHNPQFRTIRTSSNYGTRRARRSGAHLHGRHSCDMRH